MIETVYFKELYNEKDKAVISFEGDVLDILELRDYARAINLVTGKVDKGYRHEFKIDGGNKCNAECTKDCCKTNVPENEKELCDIVNEIDKEEEDLVNHPSHYTGHGMECILEMVMLYGFEETMSFCKLNAHKYRKRALDKGGRQDVDKSDWYVNTYKELAVAKEWGETALQYVCQKLDEII